MTPQENAHAIPRQDNAAGRFAPVESMAAELRVLARRRDMVGTPVTRRPRAISKKPCASAAEIEHAKRTRGLPELIWLGMSKPEAHT